MLNVKRSAIEHAGIAFVRTEIGEKSGGEVWPYVEIEPADDLLPILVQRVGVRTYRAEVWRDRKGHMAEPYSRLVRNEAAAMAWAVKRVRDLQCENN